MQQQTIETLRQALQESALPFAQQEPLASHTTFKIGGPAVFWCTPKRRPAARTAGALPETVCAHLPFWATAPTRCLPMRATTRSHRSARAKTSAYSGTTA